MVECKFSSRAIVVTLIISLIFIVILAPNLYTTNISKKLDSVVAVRGLGEHDWINTDIYPTKTVTANSTFNVLINLLGPPLQPTYDAPISIVIVNHQEPYLIKTINALLKTQSSYFINEILIIDDASKEMARYDWFLPDKRVRIIRADQRLGLIKARLIGGNEAQGPFMVILDAHIKPHDNWLVPIVRMLRENHKRILNMEVGQLDGDTWQQIELNSIGAKAGFKWDLGHFWEPFYTKDRIFQISGVEGDPDESPITMGMFATTKKWWKTINGMDSGLEIWGGENIEVSLRTWLCGGEIKVARGSFVDHTFRSKFPYTVDAYAYRRNVVRIAEAWFDEPSKIKFYEAMKIPAKSVPFGNIDEIIDLQKRLKCHSFAWYVKKFKNRSPIEKEAVW